MDNMQRKKRKSLSMQLMKKSTRQWLARRPMTSLRPKPT